VSRGYIIARAVRLCFCGAIALGDAANPAHAAAVTADVPQLQSFHPADRAYLISPAYLQLLHDKFVAAEPPERRGSCTTMDLIRRDVVMPVDHLLINRKPEPSLRLDRPTEFAATKYAGQPIIGAWSETWTLSMCGTTVRRGLVMAKTANGNIEAMAQVPGLTLTDLRLQIDTLKIGLPAFNIPKCDQTHFTVMDVEVVDASQIAQHNWREKWTILMCGELRSRIVHYGPGGPGGGTNISLSASPG
jgi:hypothetical protein